MVLIGFPLYKFWSPQKLAPISFSLFFGPQAFHLQVKNPFNVQTVQEQLAKGALQQLFIASVTREPSLSNELRYIGVLEMYHSTSLQFFSLAWKTPDTPYCIKILCPIVGDACVFVHMLCPFHAHFMSFSALAALGQT